MTPKTKYFLRGTAFLAISVLAFAQEPSSGGWRRLGDQPNVPEASVPPPEPQQQAPPPPSANYGSQQSANYGPPPQANYGPPPSDLTLRPGTYLTVRVDQVLSSDHNQAGDAFTATLVKPLVVDGVVVAQAGQTLGGRVTEAIKAGRAQGVARLGVELIDMGLVDGSQVPIKTSFVTRTAPTSVGRDVSAIGTTTAVGAAAGAIADGGVGAGIGAGAGAAAGLIGVLLTRGHPSMIYPESVLTFRVEAPVLISTARAPQAFHYVQPEEYQRAQLVQRSYARPAPPPAPYYGPVWGGYPYPYPYYGPGYWGPSIGFVYGRGYWGHPYYYRGRRW